MVSRVVEEMSFRIPILSCPLPLQSNPEKLSRFRIRQQHRQEMPFPPLIDQQHPPMIQPPNILQSQNNESKKLTNYQIG